MSMANPCHLYKMDVRETIGRHACVHRRAVHTTKARAGMARVFVLMILSAVLPANALSQGMPVVAPGATIDSGKPPEPRTGNYDWLQFKNGEWLKGKVEDLQDTHLVFRSNKLKALSLNLEDIYAIYSANSVVCVFADKTKAQGRLTVEGNRVTIADTDGMRDALLEDLRAIIPARTERDFWSAKLSTGLTLRSGNTDQSDLASFLMVQRRTSLARTRLEMNTSYSVSEGEEITNNQLGSLRQDMFLTRKIYIPSSLQYYRDKIQNIAYSLTPGIGIGYQILDQHKKEWGVDVGAGYQYTRYEDVRLGQDLSVGGASFLAGTHLSLGLTKKLDFNLQYNALLGLSDYVNTTHHGLAQLSYDVWKDLDFNFSLTWDRVGSPQERKDGTIPQADDFRLYMGIGLDF